MCTLNGEVYEEDTSFCLESQILVDLVLVV